MKKGILFFSLLLCTQILFAFEPSALNLRVPSSLDGKALVFDVQHRFYGILTEETLENFFGLDLGGNVGLGIRYAVLPRLELNANYTRAEKEYRLGASYAHYFPQVFMKGQVDIQYFDFERSGERNRNFYYGVALQTYKIGGIVIPTANIAYDGYNEKFGLGFGLDVGCDWEFGPIEHISFIGEYYPVLQSEELVTGDENYFAAGLRVDTYGHHFMLQISNGWDISPRRLMLGAFTNDVYLGLTVHRVLYF